MKPDARLILIAVACGLSGCAEGYGGGYGPAYYGSNYLGYGGGYDNYNRRPATVRLSAAAVSPAATAAGHATPGTSATTPRR